MSAFDKFMALGDFIFDEGESLATVGEAIQEHGIYKLDQNGIPKSYSVDSKVAFEALYRLVLHSGDEFAPEEYRLGADEREGFASIGGDDYGWPTSAVPDMGLARPKRPQQMSSPVWMTASGLMSSPRANLASRKGCAMATASAPSEIPALLPRLQ